MFSELSSWLSSLTFVIKFSFESLLLDSIVLRWSKIGFLAAENSCFKCLKSSSRTGANFCHSSNWFFKYLYRFLFFLKSLLCTYELIDAIISLRLLAFSIFILSSSAKNSSQGCHALSVRVLNSSHWSLLAGLLELSSCCHFVWISCILFAWSLGLSSPESLIKAWTSLIISALLGFTAKDETSLKYRDWAKTKLCLCLSLFGTDGSDFKSRLRLLSNFWPALIEPSLKWDSIASIFWNKSLCDPTFCIRWSL